MEQSTNLQLNITSDRNGVLRGKTFAPHALAAPLAQLPPAVRQELADLEPAVLSFLRADPKNVQRFTQDPVGTLRDAVKLSPDAVAAIGAVRAQSQKQYPGVPGVKLDRISIAMANEA